MAMRNYRKDATHVLEMIGATVLVGGLFILMVVLFI